MSGLRSRNKGKSGERELAKLLSALLGVNCRRGQQFSGIEGRDIVGVNGLHIECKRTEKLNLYAAYEQAARDAASGDVPTVFHRRARSPWLCVVALSDLIRFTRILQGIKTAKEDEQCQG